VPLEDTQPIFKMWIEFHGLQGSLLRNLLDHWKVALIFDPNKTSAS